MVTLVYHLYDSLTHGTLVVIITLVYHFFNLSGPFQKQGQVINPTACSQISLVGSHGPCNPATGTTKAIEGGSTDVEDR